MERAAALVPLGEHLGEPGGEEVVEGRGFRQDGPPGRRDVAGQRQVIDLLALRSGFAVTGRRCTVAELYR